MDRDGPHPRGAWPEGSNISNPYVFDQSQKRYDRARVSLGLIALIAVLPLKGEAFDFLGRPTFSPAIAAATAMVLGTIGSLAGFFPAKHASSVNPVVSLRYE